MLRFVCVLCVGLSAALSPNFAAAAIDPATAAKQIAPFLDAQAFAVAGLELSGFDVDDLSAKVAKWSGMPADRLADLRKGARDVQAQLSKAGAREMYMVFSLADIPMPGPFVLVPAPAGADADAISRVLEGLTMESTLVKDGVVAGGHKSTIERLRNLKPSPRPDLAAALGAIPNVTAIAVLVPGADQRRVFEETLPKLPAELGGGSGAIVSRGAKWAAFGIVVKPHVVVHAIVQSRDAESAKELQTMVAKGVEFVSKAGKEMDLDLRPLASVLTPKIAGDRLSLSVSEEDEAVGKVIAGAANRARSAAGRSVSMNNLKQLALALHNYHDANGSFPPTGNLDKNGKPLLSWRVHILPYVDQDQLYKQFKLDEPWDSEHNKALIAKMPKVFASPAQQVGDGKTTYLAPMAKDTVIVSGEKGAKLADVTDGTSNTIMIVETNDDSAVTWTKPDDLDVKAPEVLKKMMGHYPEGFIACFADGSVRFIRKTIDPAQLKALFTRNGGEPAGKIP
jgi:hypothetical protein